MQYTHSMDEMPYEDMDLGMTIRQHGRQVYFQPAAVVSRVALRSDDLDHAFDRGEESKELKANRELFIQKWKDLLASDHMPRSSVSPIPPPSPPHPHPHPHKPLACLAM